MKIENEVETRSKAEITPDVKNFENFEKVKNEVKTRSNAEITQKAYFLKNAQMRLKHG